MADNRILSLTIPEVEHGLVAYWPFALPVKESAEASDLGLLRFLRFLLFSFPVLRSARFGFFVYSVHFMVPKSGD